MMKFNLLYTIAILCVFSGQVNAQKKGPALIDSLQKALKNYSLENSGRKQKELGLQDSQKVLLLNSLSWELMNQGEYEEATKTSEESIELASIIGFKSGQASAYYNSGSICWNQGNFSKALQHFYNSLKINETIGNKKGIASSYMTIGIINETQQNYKEAIKGYSNALKIFKEIDYKIGIGSAYQNIGIAHKGQKNYNKAKKNYSLAMEQFRKLNYKPGIASIYNNLGLVLMEEGNYQESLENYKASLKIKEELGDKKGMASTYINIGALYTELKNYSAARENLAKGKEIANQIGIAEWMKNAYGNMSKLDSTTGNWKNAYQNYQLYILYRDSLQNEKNLMNTVQTRMQYEFDKKESEAKAEQEKKDAIINAESKKQQLILLFVSLGLLLVLLFSAYIYRSLKITNSQKNIIQRNNVEIMQSITYAKRIQSAILPPESIVKKYLPESFILYLPKNIVAGDFYWFEAIEPHEDSNADTYLYFAACDCTGHGVPGAMVSVLCNNSLNRALIELGNCDPGQLLDRTRELVLESFSKSDTIVQDGMDASLGALNLNTRQLKWSGANNPLWIHRNATLEIEEIKADKQPIGMSYNPVPFSTHTIQLNAGDTLYLFTDGYADQFGGENRRKMTKSKFKNFLLQIAHLPMDQQQKQLLQHFEEYRKNNFQVDDVCVMGVRV